MFRFWLGLDMGNNGVENTEDGCGTSELYVILYLITVPHLYDSLIQECMKESYKSRREFM